MKISDGLFLETSRRVAKEYPEIKHSDMIIDNCCMQLVSNPHQFEVMNMTNLYGTIVSNVICGIIGGAGLLAGKNYGDQVHLIYSVSSCSVLNAINTFQYAIFEPGTRNTGTAIAGKNIANPVAMLNAAVDMLYHLGHKNHAEAIRESIYKTICEDKIHTPGLYISLPLFDVSCKFMPFTYTSLTDLGGNHSSTDIVQNILKRLSEKTIPW